MTPMQLSLSQQSAAWDDAYRRGFEAAKAAASRLCRKSEESLRSQAESAGEGSDSLESMAEACFCLAEEIEQLTPEATR